MPGKSPFLEFTVSQDLKDAKATVRNLEPEMLELGQAGEIGQAFAVSRLILLLPLHSDVAILKILQ